MMKNPVRDEVRIMKDEKKREQFYLDLMDVVEKSVGYNSSIPFKKIFNREERYFTEQEEEDFIEKNRLQGIKKKTISTFTYLEDDIETNKPVYWKDTEKRKITLG